MDPDDSMKDLVEPVFRALIKGGLTIQQAYALLSGLAHEGQIWTTELWEVKEELEMEQETRSFWNRFNQIVGE